MKIFALLLALFTFSAHASNTDWEYEQYRSSCNARSWNVAAQTGYTMEMDVDANVHLRFDKGAPNDADLSDAQRMDVTLVVDGVSKTFRGLYDADDEILIIHDVGQMTDVETIKKLMTEHQISATAGKKTFRFKTENIREPLVAITTCVRSLTSR